MINIKTKLWELLKAKDISLAMLVNKEGEILWRKGREIKGKTIDEGNGFPKSFLKRSIHNGNILEEQNVEMAYKVKKISGSFPVLDIKSILILPIAPDFFLYLDSGSREPFSDVDREVLKVLGDLLGKLIQQIREKQQGRLSGITGTSESIREIRELVLKYSLVDDPVLIHGETGSGKNHIAEIIHQYSGRRGKFVTIHTPGVPENLFESEVFGHKQGAFTDARTDKKGLVEEARGGTIFFDEIAEIPPSFQARLLRFIETKKYFILGGTEEKTADIRIVASTNRDLGQAINNRQFREDLYYRLQVLEINIPPLRERKQDIRPLVIDELRHLKGKKLGKGSWETIESHDWPGNIRELKSVLKRVAILSRDDIITGDDIRSAVKQGSFKTPDRRDETVEKIREEIKAGKNFWDAVKKPFLERDINKSQVKDILGRGLTEVGGRYKDLLAYLNLKSHEYHNFMAFLNHNKIKVKKS